jgi:hypothetical protein
MNPWDRKSLSPEMRAGHEETEMSYTRMLTRAEIILLATPAEKNNQSVLFHFDLSITVHSECQQYALDESQKKCSGKERSFLIEEREEVLWWDKSKEAAKRGD